MAPCMAYVQAKCVAVCHIWYAKDVIPSSSSVRVLRFSTNMV